MHQTSLAFFIYQFSTYLINDTTLYSYHIFRAPDLTNYDSRSSWDRALKRYAKKMVLGLGL